MDGGTRMLNRTIAVARPRAVVMAPAGFAALGMAKGEKSVPADHSFLGIHNDIVHSACTLQSWSCPWPCRTVSLWCAPAPGPPYAPLLGLPNCGRLLGTYEQTVEPATVAALSHTWLAVPPAPLAFGIWCGMWCSWPALRLLI